MRKSKTEQARRMDKKKGHEAPPWDKLQGDARTEAMKTWIEEKVDDEVSRKRKFKLALVETGAMLRMVRSILTIKGTYSRQELSAPFIVPKVVFSPNTKDPDIRRALIQQGIRQLTNVYGMVPEPENALLPAGDKEWRRAA